MMSFGKTSRLLVRRSHQLVARPDSVLTSSRTLTAPLTEDQRDLHVKSLVKNSNSYFPTTALAVLHQYETTGYFAPIKSYTRVISALLNVQTRPSSDSKLGRAAAQAQAWDLFSHMRYIAHPIPDAHLYAIMIRACGSFPQPDPERALDLWMEMQENRIAPTRGAYEAIIRVCCRAGREWLGEGLRLAREMSDQFVVSGTDGKGLWHALLEGCKRTGDLKKARLILAEAVRASEDRDSAIDAELMTHMFHTYASYEPPFRRETTKLVDQGVPSNEEARTEEVVQRNFVSFSRLPPQTSSEVISESRALFDRILRDRSLSTDSCASPEGSLLAGKFARVELTSLVSNAYLSVFYRHASIEASREEFNSLLDQSHSSGPLLRPDEYTYVNALERCAIARAEERHVAARWAQDVWQRWEAAETRGLKHGKRDVGSFARLVEKAHAAMRRVLVLSGDLDGALALLRKFISQYPPYAVLQPIESHSASSMVIPKSTQFSRKPTMFSTQTVLTNSTPLTTARPLVRLTSSVTSKDDHIPPIILFSDVDLLHARLAEQERIKDLGYIKWACMAYANALKKRRNIVLKALPGRNEKDVD